MEKQHTSSGTDELRPDEPPPRDPQTVAADENAKPRRARGFAAMDRKVVSEIARKGGKAVHTGSCVLRGGLQHRSRQRSGFDRAVACERADEPGSRRAHHGHEEAFRGPALCAGAEDHRRTEDLESPWEVELRQPGFDLAFHAAVEDAALRVGPDGGHDDELLGTAFSRRARHGDGRLKVDLPEGHLRARLLDRGAEAAEDVVDPYVIAKALGAIQIDDHLAHLAPFETEGASREERHGSVGRTRREQRQQASAHQAAGAEKDRRSWIHRLSLSGLSLDASIQWSVSRRWAFSRARRFLSSIRRSTLPRVGRVLRRGLGRTS